MAAMNDDGGLDAYVDAARDVIRATREEQARIRAFQRDQPVMWDQYDYVRDEDWRTFGGIS